MIRAIKNTLDLGWVGVVIIALCAATFLLMSWLAYYVADSSFIEATPYNSWMVDRDYTAAHTATTYVQSGNVLVPITTYHPERHYIVVKTDEYGRVKCRVDKNTYDEFKIMKTRVVQLAIGRLSGDIYCAGETR